ncbi:MAG: hypothetical protein HFE49_02565 [Clostridia bacterium]|nr:hypothetical protein [Clostridia bacterium]
MCKPKETALLCGFFCFSVPYPNRVSGGVDFEAAKTYGVKVIWALSLPSKTT